MSEDSGPQVEDESILKKYGAAIVLYSVTVIMVLARSIDFVLYIRMAKKMANYEYILADILLSIGFMMVAWPVVWFKMFVTKSITKEQRSFPGYKFILMGVFDSLSVLISTIPASYVSGPINVVMSQSVVLVNMVASFFFLHLRYSPYHVAGVVLVMVGITIDVWPTFAGGASSSSSEFTWLWILLLFIANIPMAASNVYKEKYLKQAQLDVWYLNGWVAFYQLLFGLLSFPVTFIPLPAPATYISPKDFPRYFLNGLKCFFGINSITTGDTPDKCNFMWLVFIIFIAFNMTYNILILVVFQRGSSTLAVIASAARLALSNFGFLIKPLAGEAYQQKLTFYDIIALVVLIMGIVIYSAKQEKVASEDDILRRALEYAVSPFSAAWRKIFFFCYRDNGDATDEIYVRDDDSVNTRQQQQYYTVTSTSRQSKIDKMYQTE